MFHLKKIWTEKNDKHAHEALQFCIVCNLNIFHHYSRHKLEQPPHSFQQTDCIPLHFFPLITETGQAKSNSRFLLYAKYLP